MDFSNLCLGCMEEKLAKNTCPNCGYDEGTEPESLLHLTPGIILQGKYLLGRVLGQGGFGITYLTWDVTLNIKLAIKEYLPQQLATRSAGQNTVTVYKSSLAEEFHYGLNKFLEEARTLARFNEHPNIVTVRDYFEANNTAYLVMNYHEGITLQSYLESKGDKIPVEQALAIFMPILDALKEVHAAGILHRDISPDNLLIDNNGRVILIDFGAARQAMGEKSKSLSVILKAGFSPVEQYYSKGEQGPWTDIYAVAASLYKTITGTIPPESMGRLVKDDLAIPSTLGIRIDKKVEETLLNALAVKAEERYQAVEHFQKALVVPPAAVQAREGYAVIRPKEKAGSDKVDIKSGGSDLSQHLKRRPQAESAIEPDKKPELAEKLVGWGSQKATSHKIGKVTVKFALLFVFFSLIIVGVVSLFSSREEGLSWNNNISEDGVEEVKAQIDPYGINNAGVNDDKTADNNSVDTSKNNLILPRLSKEPTEFISAINANVIDFKLFEADFGRFRDEEYHIFRNSFDADETRFIYWRMNLRFPKPGVQKTFTTITYIFRSDGSLFRTKNHTHTIEPNWTWAWQSICTGWHEPGNWPADKYRIEVIVDDILVYVSAFELY